MSSEVDCAEARGNSEADTGVNKLLREIVHCPNLAKCFQSNGTFNPCGNVVRSQGVGSLASVQVPEPWSGRLREAPILFLSSNPSIEKLGEETEDYPRWSWSDAHIEDYFTNRFGGGRKNWIANGVRFLRVDGSHAPRAVAFWAAVRQRAMELLQREVVPGIDYALSEVVHCKSRKEQGVLDALDECAKRYLPPLLAFSGAKVIVVLGSVAKFAVAKCLRFSPSKPVQGPLKVGNNHRMITFLPHPNARLERSFAKCLSPDDLALLRGALQ